MYRVLLLCIMLKQLSGTILGLFFILQKPRTETALPRLVPALSMAL